MDGQVDAERERRKTHGEYEPYYRSFLFAEDPDPRRIENEPRSPAGSYDGKRSAPLQEEYLAYEAREPDQEDMNHKLPCRDAERRCVAPICDQVMVNRLDYHDEVHRVEDPI